MADEKPPESGQDVLVTCPHCGVVYDAETVRFCDCLVAARTPQCPSCGACLCKLPQSVRDAYWEAAPPVLWRRKIEDRRRDMGPADAAPSSDLKRPLILVADDEPVTLRLAQRILEKMGYGVLMASRGDEALLRARTHKPDLVLTDALMPKMDGRELCLRLKQEEETAGIKVVVMTGLFTKSLDQSSALRDYQADAFLKKPIDVMDLKEVLARLLPAPSP